MADAEHQQAEQGFSKLKPRSGSEIFTKFADVKSRISWTAERQQQLARDVGSRRQGSAIAEALGCKVGAVNVARARFGLTPRRIVSGRPKEPDEPAHKIERVAFTTSRLMEFAPEKELVAQTGHETHRWLEVIVKELVDNGIDACEEAGVAPVIKIAIRTGKRRGAKSRRASSSRTTVPAFRPRPSPASSTTTSGSRHAKRTSRPTRGRQGNALKTILPMAYVLGGKGKGETWIEARGVKHRILFTVNQIKQEPIVRNIETRFRVTDRDPRHGVLAADEMRQTSIADEDPGPAVAIHLGQSASHAGLSRRRQDPSTTRPPIPIGASTEPAMRPRRIGTRGRKSSATPGR